MKSNLHFLANSGIFLKEEIDIKVKVTGSDTPSHPSNNLYRENKQTKKTLIKENLPNKKSLTQGLQMITKSKTCDVLTLMAT